MPDFLTEGKLKAIRQCSHSLQKPSNMRLIVYGICNVKIVKVNGTVAIALMVILNCLYFKLSIFNRINC